MKRNKIILIVALVSNLVPHVYCCTTAYDKKVVINTIKNDSGSRVSQSITYTVGTSRGKSEETGGRNSNTETSGKDTSVGGNAGLSFGGLSAGVSGSFATSVGTSKTTGYNWGSTSSDTFNKGTSHSYTFECPAFKICKVTQVVGYCDGVEIKAPQIDVIHEIILKNDKEPIGVPVAEIQIPGEVWVIAKNLTFAIRSGSWERAEACSGGSRVQGFQLKCKTQTGITGYSLICSKRKENGELVNATQIQSGEAQTGTWYTPLESFFEDTYAVGFVYETWMNSSGKMFKGNWKLMMEGTDVNLHLPNWAFDVKRHETRCPQMHEICGIQTMLDKNKGAVTDIGLKCCYHCEHREAYVVRDSNSNGGSSVTSQTYTITVGTTNRKDTSTSGNQRSGTNDNTQGVQFSGLRAGFEATFGKSTSTGYDWSSSSNKMWSSDETKNMQWQCPAYTLCTLKQLVGYCGNVEVVQTPHKVVEHKRLPNYEELVLNGGEANEDGDPGNQDYTS